MSHNARPPRKKRVTRYDMREIGARVTRALADAGLDQVDVAEILEISESAVSKKMRIVGSRWDIEELGALADYLDKPHGWPILEEALSNHLDAHFPRRPKRRDDD